MSNKEIVTLNDGELELEFFAAVKAGLDELDRGEGIPLEDVERELHTWTVK